MVSLGGVFGDAWALYRLLWRRSVAVAVVVFALIGIGTYMAQRAEGSGPALATLLLGLIGQVFVQGMLVEAVRNAHEGKLPESVRSIYERAGAVFPALVFATLLYAVAVGVGFILFIVPGLIVLARWSMFPPIVVLERVGAGEALRRSSALVKGRTGSVLLIILVMYVGIGIPNAILQYAVGSRTIAAAVIGFVYTSLAAPFEAHVLTTLYYRLTQPDRPVVHPSLRS